MGTMYCGVRTKTFIDPTSGAMVWITWMPVAPVPTTATRLPLRSTPPFGHRPVWVITPLNVDWPGKRSFSGADSMPQQASKYCVSMCSPSEVTTSQRPSFSRHKALIEQLRHAQAANEIGVNVDIERAARFVETTMFGLQVAAKAGVSLQAHRDTAAFAIASLRDR